METLFYIGLMVGLIYLAGALLIAAIIAKYQRPFTWSWMILGSLVWPIATLACLEVEWADRFYDRLFERCVPRDDPRAGE